MVGFVRARRVAHSSTVLRYISPCSSDHYDSTCPNGGMKSCFWDTGIINKTWAWIDGGSNSATDMLHERQIEHTHFVNRLHYRFMTCWRFRSLAGVIYNLNPSIHDFIHRELHWEIATTAPPIRPSDALMLRSTSSKSLSPKNFLNAMSNQTWIFIWAGFKYARFHLSKGLIYAFRAGPGLYLIWFRTVRCYSTFIHDVNAQNGTVRKNC